MDFLTLLQDPTAIYVAAVIVVGLLGAGIVNQLLTRAAQRRRDHIENLQRFVAVRTESSKRNRPGEAKERALESVETRFRMMKRILLPLLGIVWAILLGIPFLNKASATAVSLLAALLAVIIGIAAKPLLENMVAGIMVSFSQPIRIGDVVRIEERLGIIEDITLTHTVVKLWDWRRLVIPNQKLLQLEFLNYTLIDHWQWGYLSFWVEPGADMDLVQDIALKASEASHHRDPEKPPGFWIIEVDKDGVLCWVAAWVDHPMHVWGLRHDMAMALTKGLKAHGIRSHLQQLSLADWPEPIRCSIQPEPPAEHVQDGKNS